MPWRDAVEQGDRRPGRLRRLVAGHRRLAERADRRARGLRERPEPVEEVRDLPRRRVEVLQRRRLAVGDLAERLHRRLQLLEEAGELLQARRDLGPPLGRCLRRVVRLHHEAADVLAVGGEVADDRVGVDGQVLQRPVLVAEQREDLVRLAQRRDRAADRGVELRAAPGDARAELRDDDPQPLALGLAEDVVDEVGRDRRRRLRDRDPRARLELLPRRAREAVEEVLADQRLRARLAVHVAPQRPEAVLVDAEADERVLRALVEPDVGDLAGPHARDLEVAALDQPEGVVELDPVRVVPRPAEAGREDHVGAQRRDEAEDDERAPHLPSGPSDASHGKSGDGL